MRAEIDHRATPLSFRKHGVVHNEWHMQRLFIMIPLSGQPAVGHQKPIVTGVDNHSILIEPRGLQFLENPRHGVIDTGDHPVIGSHVGLIFFRRVPAPVIAQS